MKPSNRNGTPIPTEECGFCKSLWEQIRKREDELTKLERHEGIYGKAIEQVQQELAWRYRKAEECRNKNHPDEMY